MNLFISSFVPSFHLQFTHLLLLCRILSNISAGKLINCCLIFRFHFFMFFGLLITSNFPDFISLYCFCFFFNFRACLIYFLFSIFFTLYSLISPLNSLRSLENFCFSSQVKVDLFLLPLATVDFCLSFHGLLLLFIPTVNSFYVDFICSGSGNAS